MEIIWSKNSEITFDVITKTIDTNFGRKSAKKFISKVDSIIKIIQKHPQIYKSFFDFENVRKAAVNKQCSFIYEINKTNITILYFWDNRQKPLD